LAHVKGISNISKKQRAFPTVNVSGEDEVIRAFPAVLYQNISPPMRGRLQ